MSNKIIPLAHIQQRRDERYRQKKSLQVRSIPAALEFINDVGFCFAFKAPRAELPCLWHAACGESNPVYPRHSHHDPHISLVWQAKDVLPAQAAVYYGKAIKKIPGFISLPYLPAFLCLQGVGPNAEEYVKYYLRGELSQAARRIMDALTDRTPQLTRDLKMDSGMGRPEQRGEFDKAMTELQMKLLVLKIGEFYDPFSFLWDLVRNRFPEAVQQALTLSPDEARKQILQQYFRNVIAAQSVQIQRLFGWSKIDIRETLATLTADGDIRENVIIPERRGQWYVSAGV